jgi:hypothetical protein
MRRIRSYLTFANVVSLAALFLALSGGAVALEGRRNVDHNDLRQHVVHRGKIHDEAVNSAKLAGGAVRAPDLGRIRVGSETTTVTPNNNGQVGESCQAGERRIGGGAFVENFAMALSGSRPTDNGWDTHARNNTASPIDLTVYILCLRR